MFSRFKFEMFLVVIVSVIISLNRSGNKPEAVEFNVGAANLRTIERVL